MFIQPQIDPYSTAITSCKVNKLFISILTSFRALPVHQSKKDRQISCIHRSIINFAFLQQHIHHQACNKDSYIRCRSLICMLRPRQDRPCSSNIRYLLRLCHDSLLFKHLFKYTIYKYKCVLHFFHITI